jgi:membrane protein implicated in regulation of membrane protease activity
VFWACGLVVALVAIPLLLVNLYQLYPGMWEDLSRERRELTATIIGIVVALTVIIVLLAIGGASLGWTGFGGKKLWDWLQLLSALAIPVVLATAGFWFTTQQDTRQQRIENQRAQQAQNIENQRAKAERELAEQRAQDEALQAYLSQMSSLLLEKDLRASKEESEMRTLARARTLTVLGRLDPSRKIAVMDFLEEADLIQSVDQRAPIIALAGADLSGANLSEANLSGATLSEANLSGANLEDADLYGANLINANLNNADLSEADLNDADLNDADLSEADLGEATLGNADLSDANLSDANLDETYLSRALLWSADLSSATLSDVDLSDANLSATAGITHEELEQQVYSFGGAIMPNGTQTDPTPPPEQTESKYLNNLIANQVGPFTLDSWERDTADARARGAVDGVNMFYRHPDKPLLLVNVWEFPSSDGAKHSGLHTSVANAQSNGYQVVEELPLTTNEGKQLGQSVRLHQSGGEFDDMMVWNNTTLSITTISESEDAITQFYQKADY